MKKAQGLPVSTVILAAIGLVVLVLLFALVTGRLGILGRGLSECQGSCIGPYTGNSPEPNVECDSQLSKELPGAYILSGQQGVPQDQLKKCTKCCAALA